MTQQIPREYPPVSAPAAWVFLAAAAAIVTLRLVIWKFFPDAEMQVKEDLSNQMVALAQFVFAGAFGVLLIRRGAAYRPTGFEAPVLLMVLAAAATLFWTADFSVSLRQFLPLAASAVFFLVLAQVLDTHPRRKTFLFFLLALAVMTAAFGIREYFYLNTRFTGNDASIADSDRSLYYILTRRRVTSFLGWPNSLAGYLHLVLPFALAGMVFLRAWWLRGLMAAVSLCLLGCFLVTFSFLGWISFLLAGAFLVPELLRRLVPAASPRLRWGLLAGGLLLALMFVLVIVRKDFASSLLPRVAYHRQAVALVGEHPVLGHGWGMFQLSARPMVTSFNDLTSYVHNSYLQWWVEAGLPGLAGILFFTGMVIVAGRRALRRWPEGENGLVAVAVVWAAGAFLIDNMYSFTFLKPNIAVHGWTLLAVLAALHRETTAAVRFTPDWRQITGAWAGLLAMIFLAAQTSLLVSGIFFQHAGNRALQRNEVNRAADLFVRGSLVDRWSASYPLGAADAAIRDYQANRREYPLRVAEANYLEAIRRQPVQYAPHFLLSRIYLELGEQSKALEQAREARGLSPFEYQRDTEALRRMAERSRNQ